jgi:hypothetical protein
MATGVLIALGARAGGGDVRSSVQATPSSSAEPGLTTDARNICQEAVHGPKNKGYGFAGMKAAETTTIGGLDAWFKDKNGRNMPSHSVKEYPSLANQPLSAPVTYCLFKATNLSIPHPLPSPGSSAPPLVFDGVELLVTGPGSYTVGSFGGINKMTTETDTHPTAAP